MRSRKKRIPRRVSLPVSRKKMEEEWAIILKPFGHVTKVDDEESGGEVVGIYEGKHGRLSHLVLHAAK